jgi:hypothetical protein
VLNELWQEGSTYQVVADRNSSKKLEENYSFVQRNFIQTFKENFIAAQRSIFENSDRLEGAEQ